MNWDGYLRAFSGWPFIASVASGLVVSYIVEAVAGRTTGTVFGAIVCFGMWVICAKISARRAARELKELETKWRKEP
jgi:uncharacterized membrane protein YciS (DUF1049 family)